MVPLLTSVASLEVESGMVEPMSLPHAAPLPRKTAAPYLSYFPPNHLEKQESQVMGRTPRMYSTIWFKEGTR